MSRKAQNKVLWREGQTRKSPRISALDAIKENQQQQCSFDQEEEMVRGKNKRKFDDSVDLVASASKIGKQVWKGRGNQQDEDHSTKCVEWRSFREPEVVKENTIGDGHRVITDGKTSVIQDKSILELILDTLQRRDTYEIFAEPVDPDEVEDYYKFIKEPMDFGTMRAKLHEGLYTTIEQFEHDVFLIPENAMYFNSSSTLYFRQARALHELAKKVFDALKTDPENFVREYSGTRRRSMRKAVYETNGSSKFSYSKSRNRSSEVPQKGTFKRSYKKRSLSNDGFRSKSFLAGNREGRFYSSEEQDRRSTYLPRDKNLFGSIFHTDFQMLVPMNWGGNSYEESLMSFVKDLGPIAQMVAKRKLFGLQMTNSIIQLEENLVSTAPQRKPENTDIVKTKSDSSNVENLNMNTSFKTFRDFASGSTSFVRKTNNIIDLTEEGEKDQFRTSEKVNTDSAPPSKETTNRVLKQYERRNATDTRKGLIEGGERVQLNALNKRPFTSCTPEQTKTKFTPAMKEKTDRTNRVLKRYERRNTGESSKDLILYPSSKHTRSVLKRYERRNTGESSKDMILYPSSKHTRRSDDNPRPVILALENPRSNGSEYKAKNKPALPWNVHIVKRTVEESSKAKQIISEPIMAMPIAAQFTFDLPFLKAKLNQMNSMGSSSTRFQMGGNDPAKRGAEMGRNCIRQAEAIGFKSFAYKQSISRSSFNKMDSNFTLQL